MLADYHLSAVVPVPASIIGDLAKAESPKSQILKSQAKLKPSLHWSSNPVSIHLQSRSGLQSINGCGLSQSRIESDWWVFTVEANRD